MEKGSIALRTANDEFRRSADGLNLWSFYETTRTNVGATKSIVVDYDSAVIGTCDSKSVTASIKYEKPDWLVRSPERKGTASTREPQNNVQVRQS